MPKEVLLVKLGPYTTEAMLLFTFVTTRSKLPSLLKSPESIPLTHAPPDETTLLEVMLPEEFGVGPVYDPAKAPTGDKNKRRPYPPKKRKV